MMFWMSIAAATDMMPAFRTQQLCAYNQDTIDIRLCTLRLPLNYRFNSRYVLMMEFGSDDAYMTSDISYTYFTGCYFLLLHEYNHYSHSILWYSLFIILLRLSSICCCLKASFLRRSLSVSSKTNNQYWMFDKWSMHFKYNRWNIQLAD